MKHVSRLGVPAVIAIVAGCASGRGADSTTDPAPIPAAEAMPEEAHSHAGMQSRLPATAGPGYTVADVRFMQDMIGHHAQAVEMAALLPGRAAGEPLTRLAEKIDISQRDEIAFMERWLRDRGQAVPERRHAMPMPGMLTPEQMARLSAASGREFERLFLSFMIRHHRGALQMVETLFASPGAGQDSDIFRFATDVDADQRDEIWVMQTMLDSMDTNGSHSR
jgi:uncharacterized protein (DUF305 family)